MKVTCQRFQLGKSRPFPIEYFDATSRHNHVNMNFTGFDVWPAESRHATNDPSGKHQTSVENNFANADITETLARDAQFFIFKYGVRLGLWRHLDELLSNSRWNLMLTAPVQSSKANGGRADEAKRETRFIQVVYVAQEGRGFNETRKYSSHNNLVYHLANYSQSECRIRGLLQQQ